MLREHVSEIVAGLEHGMPLASIEAELIEPSAELNDDERAALWLFAWSYGALHPVHRFDERGLVPIA